MNDDFVFTLFEPVFSIYPIILLFFGSPSSDASQVFARNENDTYLKAKHPKSILRIMPIDNQRAITSEAKLSGVLIANRYGWIEWKDKHGKTLDELKRR